MVTHKELETLLTKKYTNVAFYWDDDPLVTRLSGTITSPDFQGKTQLDRQRELGAYLRDALGKRATGVGIIFAFTPEEREAILEPA